MTDRLSMIAPSACPPRGAGRAARLLGLALGVLLCATPAAAQQRGTVTGSVTDAAASRPISGASVVVVGTGQGAITRNDGSYRLTLPAGRYQILARHLGFSVARDSVVVTAGETVNRDFRLEETAVALDQVVAVGSRTQERTVTESPVPVDVLTRADLVQTGKTETAQIIQVLAPSFNFPRPSVTDGTDHVRPATLRGLGPDQVLVLINGKRRHTSALVNINGSVGRGSTGVDFNAIPSSAIDRVEILRDGAAAQYGSDAIAGVINIILKSDAEPELQTQFGQNKEGDGRVLQGALNVGRILGSDGYVHLTGEIRDKDSTNRSLPDTRPQCLSGDPRCNEALVRNTQTHWLGDAKLRDAGFFLNAALPSTHDVTFYGFGGASIRHGKAAGFFRRSLDPRNVRDIYGNGFLPYIESQVVDYSVDLGARGAVLGGQWDLSTALGHNSFDFDVTHSLNASMGVSSPTRFYSGTQEFNQLTNNLDFTRSLNIGWLAKPLDVAVGAEVRVEGYHIYAGEPASYMYGGVPILDGPSAGQPAAPGAQVFPGFQPADAIYKRRSNAGGYLDLEGSVLPSVTVGAAVRAEDYTDFGSAGTGKVSARWEIIPAVALRGSLQSGFRAPSLAQEWLSATSTNFQNVGGQSIPFDIKTFPATSNGGKALGAKPLEPERSVNYGYGLTLQPLRNLSVTADLYRLDIRKRIVFTGNFTGTQITNRLAAIGYPNVTGARFFTNAVNTMTKGLDVVAMYGVVLPSQGTLRFTAGFNRNYTKITNNPNEATPPELGSQGQVLFDRVEWGRLTRGQPNFNAQLGVAYQQGPVGLSLHETRYGDVTLWNNNNVTNPDQTFHGKGITDAEVSYHIAGTTVALGGQNVFDVYPDKLLPANGNSGIFPYSGLSPWGFNGAYYYVRATVGLGGR